MRRARIGLIVFGGMAASLLIYLLIPPSSPAWRPVTDALPVIAALFAVSMCLFSRGDLAFSRTMRRSLALFAAGIALWTLGEATWFVYENLLGVVNPYPSLADVFWLLGYPLLAAGAFYSLRVFGTLLDWNVIFVAGASFLCIFILTAWLLFVPIAQDTSIGRMERALDIAYPGLDLVLLLVTVIILGTVFRGLHTTPWLYLSAGLVAFAFADLLFSYLTWNDSYPAFRIPSAFADLGWIAGYLLLAKGFFEIRAVISERAA